MKNPSYAMWTSPDGSDKVVQERDSTRCSHCQKLIFVKPGTVNTVYLIPYRDLARHGQYAEEPGAFCRQCMHAICLPCHDAMQRGCGCSHFMRAIELSEAKSRLAAQIIGYHG